MSNLTLLGAGGPSQAGVSPDSVSGLDLWLKADAITLLNDGDPVTTWLDSSSNLNNVTQAVAGSKPTYKTNILNSLPVVRFATDDVLASATYTPSSTTHTIFVAYANRSGSNGSFYSTNNSNGPLQRSTAIWYQGSSPSITATDLNTKKLLTLLFDYNTDNYAVRQNGVAGNTGTTVTTLTGTTLNIGARQAGEFLNGDIAEFIIYNSIISGSNLTGIELYLKNKWTLY